MHLKKIVLIPQWVSKSLEHHGYSISDSIDPKIFCSVLSADDVGFYIAIQDMAKIFHKLNLGYLQSGSGTLTESIEEEELYDINRYIVGYHTQNDLNKIEQSTALFGSMSSNKDLSKLSFDVVEISADTIGLIPTYGVEEFNVSAILKKIVDAMSKFINFKELVTTREFKSYVEMI